MTLEKQVFWQNTRALRMTAAAVHSECSSFLTRSQDAAKTSLSELRIRKPTPTEALDRDCERVRFNLKTESERGGDHFQSGAVGTVNPFLLTSINSITYTEAPDHKPSEQGVLFSKMNLFRQFHIIQSATHKISNSRECKGKVKRVPKRSLKPNGLSKGTFPEQMTTWFRCIWAKHTGVRAGYTFIKKLGTKRKTVSTSSPNEGFDLRRNQGRPDDIPKRMPPTWMWRRCQVAKGSILQLLLKKISTTNCEVSSLIFCPNQWVRRQSES